MRRILVGTVAVGIVGNAIDWLLNKFVWAGVFTSATWINPDPPMMWMVIGDFAAAFMLMLAWDKFGGAYGRGAGAGFKFGLFAGAFISFPAVLFWQMYVKGFGYTLAWEIVVVNVVAYGVWGAVAAMLDGNSNA